MALRRTLASLLPLPLLLLAACATTPLEQRAWIEVRSPNFSILTDLGRDEAIRLSEEIELFRAVLTKLTNARRFEPRVPTRIFAFARGRDFRAFAVANSGNSAQPQVRVRLYQGTTLVQTSTINSPSGAVPTAANEGTVTSSWNVLVPGALVQAGLRVMADVDPGNAVAEADETNNQFPLAGQPAQNRGLQRQPLRPAMFHSWKRPKLTSD